MAERTYYVICSDNCKFEGLTKEQILTAITQAVSTGEIKDVDTGFVTKIIEQNANASLKIWVGTAAEFNALETKDANTLYIYPDTTLEDLDDALQKVVDGTTPVKEAKHATNADSATNAAKTSFSNKTFIQSNTSDITLTEAGTYQFRALGYDFGIVYWDGNSSINSTVATAIGRNNEAKKYMLDISSGGKITIYEEVFSGYVSVDVVNISSTWTEKTSSTILYYRKID